MHGNEVAVENAGIFHGHAGDFEQVVRARRKDIRVDIEARFDVFFCENGLACRDATDERQAELFAQRVFQLDTTRGARHECDDALTGKRTQMLLGGIGGPEPELLRDFCPRGRHAGLGNSSLDEAKDFGLSWGQVGHGCTVVNEVKDRLFGLNARVC